MLNRSAHVQSRSVVQISLILHQQRGAMLTVWEPEAVSWLTSYILPEEEGLVKAVVNERLKVRRSN